MPYEIHLVLSDGIPRDFFRKLGELTNSYSDAMLYEMSRPVEYTVPKVSHPLEELVAEDLGDTEIISLNIRNLGLHARTVGALSGAYKRGYAKSEIETIGDLLKYSAEDLLAMPQLGYVGLHNIRVALAKYGLHLMLEDVYEPEEG